MKLYDCRMKQVIDANSELRRQKRGVTELHA